MAASDSTQEKTEAPTKKKRDDARKEGQVAFSKEVSSSLILGAVLLLFYFTGSALLQSAMDLFKFSFRDGLEVSALTIPLLSELFQLYLSKTAIIILPFVFTILPIGIFACVIQVGFQITGKAIVPKFEKMSPIKGFGRIFSKQAFNEFLKSIFKLSIIGYLGYITFTDSIGAFLDLPTKDLQEIIKIGFNIFGLFIFRLFMALLTLAFFDYLFQRWDLEQKLKMSKQDIKEELKQSEGDPQLKAKIKQIQKSLSQARMMQDVPGSDAVITNPTHFSVAIKYDQEIMASPQIVAKGADLVALRIMEIAKENNVAIIRNPPVARGLYSQLEIGDEIPEKFFKAIAEILAFVYKSKKKG